MKHLFLWDIDGTLLLTGGAGVTAFNRVFEELFKEAYIWGSHISPDGRTDDLIIEELFRHRFNRVPTLDELKSIAGLYGQYMEEEVPKAGRFRLMPYAVETLERLHQKEHVVLGLATGNYEPAAWAKLERAGLRKFFKFGGFGSDARERQQMTEIARKKAELHLGGNACETWVVGDTVYDIRCGKGIGAKTIAVATGSTPRRVLEGESPDFVLDDLSQFPWEEIDPEG